MTVTTIGFLIRSDEICLGMKKVRYGIRKWNGFGGRVGDKEEFKNETVEDGLEREANEEFNIDLVNFEKIAEISYKSFDGSDDIFANVFICKEWVGEPSESEEISPKWFKISEIPYDNMWPNDKIWMPLVLEGKKLNASFVFDKEGNVIDQKIEII